MPDNPNVYRDPGPWGDVLIGDVYVPGTVVSIDGCGTPAEWAFQKGTGGNFASSIWRGDKLSEEIKIKTRLTTEDDVDRAYMLRDALRPKRGKKPPSFSIVNPQINFGGITRCSIKDPGTLIWDPKSGAMDWEIAVAEYNPSKTAPTGPADPAKPADEPKPKDAAEEELKNLMDKADKA